jgi:hypothetical protein
MAQVLLQFCQSKNVTESCAAVENLRGLVSLGTARFNLDYDCRDIDTIARGDDGSQDAAVCSISSEAEPGGGQTPDRETGDRSPPVRTDPDGIGSLPRQLRSMRDDGWVNEWKLGEKIRVAVP